MNAANRDDLLFALTTTAAALLGLVVAWSLGIGHPWWAAMTLWLVAQPTRGLLLERAIARLAGTAIGAVIGSTILLMAAGDRLIVLVALAIWLSLCAAGGSVFRHFRTYAFVLAGYSAAIIALFGLAQHGGDASVPADRIYATVIGILCSVLVSVIIVRPSDDRRLAAELEDLVGRCLDRIETFLVCRTAPAPEPLLHDLLVLDRGADDSAAGSARERRAAWQVRRTSGVLLELLALTPTTKRSPHPAAPSGDCGGARIKRLCALAEAQGQSRLASRVHELGEAMTGPTLAWNLRGRLATVDPRRVARAALRPLLAFSIASAIWLATDWREGTVMVMTAALFSSLFSSHRDGNRALLDALLGSVLGAIIGAAFRLFVLPPDDVVISVIQLLPILLAGAWFMRVRRTAKPAIDFTMTLLLIAQPLSPPTSFSATLGASAAIIAGIVIAFGAFRVFVPASVAVSRRSLWQRIERLAAQRRMAPNPMAANHNRAALREAVLRLLHTTPPDRIDAALALAVLADAKRDSCVPR
ncbi:FUSC family protein [Sphingomonas prati]|uniref:Putative membrane protein YccC n=1 Tax=Sphingomonas prati TaxID=1843237 RepID=A0A7W9F2T9_9SPHN|nr:FUSC family protein [Sphingomonas prati]MBB5730758.1 putative membrane protein YccC [Sphingomonas prati]GGE96539.1 hypothetical protein GCM10011404_32070 [Sphingomonas prati]